jgi:hypothetical protein
MAYVFMVRTAEPSGLYTFRTSNFVSALGEIEHSCADFSSTMVISQNPQRLKSNACQTLSINNSIGWYSIL